MLLKGKVAQVTNAAPRIGRIRLTKDEVDIDIIDLNDDKMFVVSHELAAAQEYANTGITVNAYCPGVVEADMWTKIDKRFSLMSSVAEGDTYKKYVDRMTLDRAQTSAGIANFVSYLSSPDFEGFPYYFLQRWLGNT
jgi:NAD(P)-dependent dehydrogenase (short-subunit alcohol dehydrogenase family)